MRGFLAAAMLALTACGGGHAAVVTATPETVRAALDDANGGDIIRLAPGDYPAMVLAGKVWTPEVTVEAGAARMASVTLRRVSGLTWHGGVFDGNDTERYGFHAQSGERIVVQDTKMTRYVRFGIGFSEISDARLVNNAFTDMGSDGIDIAMSRRLLIDRTSCTGFKPTPGAHPDCVQLWSRPTAAPTADVTISHTEVNGDVQGVTMFNHVRDGVDDGGFDRITVANNHVRSLQYNGITMQDCRECVARENRVETIPNPKIKSWLRAGGKGNVELCGNTIVAFPALPGQQACSTRSKPGN